MERPGQTHIPFVPLKELHRTAHEVAEVVPETLRGQVLAQQLAGHLHPERIRTGEKVISIQATTVTLESGEQLTGRHVVLATEGPAAAQLVPEVTTRQYHQATCLYFSAPASPMTGPYLILNGEKTGILNSVCVLSEVAHSYAPPGQHLISVATHKNPSPYKDNIEEAVRSQLTEWFGRQTQDWQHLRTYRLSHAQPVQFPPFDDSSLANSKLRDGLFICGDHRTTATFDGALGSGRRTAEEIINELKT